jgi:hypothetical protein
VGVFVDITAVGSRTSGEGRGGNILADTGDPYEAGVARIISVNPKPKHRRVESVMRACGSRHAVFQNLFDESPDRAAFDALWLSGCVVCHGYHEIRKPRLDMPGVADTTVCLNCHMQGDPGYAPLKRCGSEWTGLSLL